MKLGVTQENTFVDFVNMEPQHAHKYTHTHIYMEAHTHANAPTYMYTCIKVSITQGHAHH